MIRLLILDFNNQQILDYNSLMQTQKKAKIRSWLCGLKPDPFFTLTVS